MSAGRVLRSDSRAMADALTPARTKTLFFCPLCPRQGLRNEMGFWNHMRGKHSPQEIIVSIRPWRRMEALMQAPPKADALLESAEEMLIRIVNSETHEEAVRIATAALCGKDCD